MVDLSHAALVLGLITVCTVAQGCAGTPPLPTPAAAAPPTSTSVPPTSTPVSTATPTVSTIKVEGIDVPDPKFTNPELFDLTQPDSPIPQFTRALEKAGIQVFPQKVLDSLSDPGNLQVKTAIDGTTFLLSIFKMTHDGVDYATGLIYNQDQGWREATTGNLASTNALLIGSNIRVNPRGPLDYPFEETNAIVGNEFNSAILDEHFTFWKVEPTRDQFSFGTAESELHVAQDTGVTPIGGHLIYGYNNFKHPWLQGQTFTREQVKEIVTNHVGQVVSHFKDKVSYWLVVNEVGNGDGYLEFDPTYPQEAFAAAQEANPDAQLIYNFEIGTLNSVDTHALALFRQIDAKKMLFGLQGHLDGSQIGNEETLVHTLQGYGVPVFITELDINMKNIRGTPEERQQVQAELYQRVMRATLESGVCRGVNFWELGDKYSWLEEPGATGSRYSEFADPTLFDDDLSPKPALFAVRAALLPEVP